MMLMKIGQFKLVPHAYINSVVNFPTGFPLNDDGKMSLLQEKVENIMFPAFI